MVFVNYVWKVGDVVIERERERDTRRIDGQCVAFRSSSGAEQP